MVVKELAMHHSSFHAGMITVNWTLKVERTERGVFGVFSDSIIKFFPSRLLLAFHRRMLVNTGESLQYYYLRPRVTDFLLYLGSNFYCLLQRLTKAINLCRLPMSISPGMVVQWTLIIGGLGCSSFRLNRQSMDNLESAEVY